MHNQMANLEHSNYSTTEKPLTNGQTNDPTNLLKNLSISNNNADHSSLPPANNLNGVPYNNESGTSVYEQNQTEETQKFTQQSGNIQLQNQQSFSDFSQRSSDSTTQLHSAPQFPVQRHPSNQNVGHVAPSLRHDSQQQAYGQPQVPNRDAQDLRQFPHPQYQQSRNQHLQGPGPQIQGLQMQGPVLGLIPQQNPPQMIRAPNQPMWDGHAPVRHFNPAPAPNTHGFQINPGLVEIAGNPPIRAYNLQNNGNQAPMTGQRANGPHPAILLKPETNGQQYPANISTSGFAPNGGMLPTMSGHLSNQMVSTPQIVYMPNQGVVGPRPAYAVNPNNTVAQQAYPSIQNIIRPQLGYPSNSSASGPMPGYPPNLIGTGPMPGYPPHQSVTGPMSGQQPNLNASGPIPGYQPHPNTGGPIPGYQPNSNASGPIPGHQPNQIASGPMPGYQPNPNVSGPMLGYQPNPMPSQQRFTMNQRPGMPYQTQGFAGNMPSQRLGMPQLPFGNMPIQSNLPTPNQQFGGPPPGAMYNNANNYAQNQFPPAQPNVGMPGMPGYPNSEPKQMYKLDPDSIPNPLQLLPEEKANVGSLFVTNERGAIPPTGIANYQIQDGGNASPSYIRSTMYCIPNHQDLMKQCHVPFGLVVSPFPRLKLEMEPPIIDASASGPVRCNRCKAYMNPFMQFVDGGRRFFCVLCKSNTDTPPEYFQHLDHTGLRVDRFERPELICGTYEFVVTKDYCKDGQMPGLPAFVFVIDVTYNNVKSGLLGLLCENMKGVLKNVPVCRVGFITFNTSVHFYNIKSTLGQPQMMVVGDIRDMFAPMQDGFLCSPEESEVIIDILLESLPRMFENTTETMPVCYAAMKAGLAALTECHATGKLFVFLSSIAVDPKVKEESSSWNILGTDKEPAVKLRNTQFTELAFECVQAGVGVDLFLTNNGDLDLTSLAQISKLTGGEIYKYKYFQAPIDGERLILDLIGSVEKRIGFDSIVRVRTSPGVRPVNFYGNFLMNNATDVELGIVSSHTTIAAEVKHDDNLPENEGVFVQVAVLYTACNAQRRVRVINLSLNDSSKMADLFSSCDIDSLVNYLSKSAISKLYQMPARQVKEALVSMSNHVLSCYRKNCADPAPPGQLILPEKLKLLPLYINCILKSDIMANDLSHDDRVYTMTFVASLDVESSKAFFYPRLIQVTDLDVKSTEIPDPMRATFRHISRNGAYILENGLYMFLWVGNEVNSDWMQNVLGVNSSAELNRENQTLPDLENPLSKRINAIVNAIFKQRRRVMRLVILRENDKWEVVFKNFLVEDGMGSGEKMSYVDFLFRIHGEIRNLIG